VQVFGGAPLAHPEARETRRPLGKGHNVTQLEILLIVPSGGIAVVHPSGQFTDLRVSVPPNGHIEPLGTKATQKNGCPARHRRDKPKGNASRARSKVHAPLSRTAYYSGVAHFGRPPVQNKKPSQFSSNSSTRQQGRVAGMITANSRHCATRMVFSSCALDRVLVIHRLVVSDNTTTGRAYSAQILIYLKAYRVSNRPSTPKAAAIPRDQPAAPNPAAQPSTFIAPMYPGPPSARSQHAPLCAAANRPVTGTTAPLTPSPPP